MKKQVAAMAVGLVLSGCVRHEWAPGPQVAAEDFGRVSGQCKLMAQGAPGEGGFVAAVGRPAFVGGVVGGVLLLGAIGGAVRTQNIYNSCMEAAGFEAVD